MMSSFDKNVFINSPFDDDYRDILLSIVFTVSYFGFSPRLSLERSNAGETRIDKIVTLINSSKFGIHDLSRIEAVEEGECFRMNMPFELGIDYGCQKLRSGKYRTKKILILEKEKYRYQKALSDLSGSDIKSHNDKPHLAMKAVRDWLITEELKKGPSSNVVWDKYNDFHAFLYDEVVEKNGYSSIDDIQISEIICYMAEWIAKL